MLFTSVVKLFQLGSKLRSEIRCPDGVDLQRPFYRVLDWYQRHQRNHLFSSRCACQLGARLPALEMKKLFRVVGDPSICISCAVNSLSEQPFLEVRPTRLGPFGHHIHLP